MSPIPLVDGQQFSCDELPGSYPVSELDPSPNFQLTDIVCDDGASAVPSTVDLASRRATFNTQ